MLLKHIDGRKSDMRELERALTRHLSERQREAVEQELHRLEEIRKRARLSGEYLDYHFDDSHNWALIHDLRFDHRGMSAQIDHVLINRFLDLYVIGTKQYRHGMKLTEEGEFHVWDGEAYHPISSPYEENQQQILALQHCIGDNDLGPRRQGVVIPVKYRNVTLMAPDVNLVKPELTRSDFASVMKVNDFAEQVEKNLAAKSVIDASKMVSLDTLQTFGERLVRLHRLPTLDLAALLKE